MNSGVWEWNRWIWDGVHVTFDILNGNLFLAVIYVVEDTEFYKKPARFITRHFSI